MFTTKNLASTLELEDENLSIFLNVLFLLCSCLSMRKREVIFLFSRSILDEVECIWEEREEKGRLSSCVSMCMPKCVEEEKDIYFLGLYQYYDFLDDFRPKSKISKLIQMYDSIS